MRTKLKKVFSILLTLALVIGLNLVLPQTAKAATFQSSGCVSDVVIDSSGYLKSMKVAIVPIGSYATAYGKVAVHSKASAYDWNNRYIKTGASNWNGVDNTYLENNDGLMHWADGDEFVWTDGPHDVTIQFSNNEVYLNSSTPIDLYIYLWTRSPSWGIYTDGLISHLTVGNGAIKEGSTVLAYHTHSFTYSATGADLTATCTAESCTLDDGTAQHNHAVKLTLSAPDATYTGSAYTGSKPFRHDGMDGCRTDRADD